MMYLLRLFAWLAALLSKKTKPQSPSENVNEQGSSDETATRPPVHEDAAPWLALARKEDGVRETAGSGSNPVVLQYYKDAGHPEITSDEVSWCAAFVGAMLERSGVASSKSLAARSYLTWGKKLDRPKPGCVVVLWRTSPKSWQGHVGFYVGEDSKSVFLLGGNQADAVNVSKYPKDRILGFRWPSTVANSRTYRGLAFASAGQALSLGGDAVAQIVAELLPVAAELKSLSGASEFFGYVGSAITILALGWVAYARFDDWRRKGR